MTLPTPAAAFARTVGATVCAAVVASLVTGGVPSARAAALRREAIRSGDTVLADILAPGEIDEYAFDAPRGGRVVVTFGPVSPGRWNPAIGLHDGTYGPVAILGPAPGVAVNQAPLGTSGTHRLIVSSVEPSVGGYRIRLAVSPGRSFPLAGAGDTTPAPLVFGAVPGSDVTVSLRWRGPAPVTLSALTGPDGAPLTAATGPRVRGTTSLQKGFRTVGSGDHAAAIAVPTGTKSWVLRIAVKPPRAQRGSTRDLRSSGAPALPGVQLLNTTDNAVVLIEGETGGPNDVIAYLGGASPGVRILDDRRLGCGAVVVDPGPSPTSYQFACVNGWLVRVRDTVRTGGLVTSFDAFDVRSPSGTGRTTLSDAVYDGLGRPVAWTETRTFDASGRTHVLRMADFVRRSDGAIVAYSVTHTPPGGAERRYDYGPSVPR